MKKGNDLKKNTKRMDIENGIGFNERLKEGKGQFINYAKRKKEKVKQNWRKRVKRK